MSDWQLASLIGLLGALVLVVASLRSQRFTTSFVIRSAAIWAAIILVITVIAVYRQEIGDFLGVAP
ncbi:hypothetical protein OF829_18105 [Sphingomonas sp. LB-2]|uniref:hypothetical protein n=1 Tax=Sphingomonas caeni TaxID=2984949 RepID=UPI00222EE8A8|nr:hypothetical protein [Sphingomonas caeni]MCW3849156.1 hypothetical protein [Sphingomonas caeni]